MVFEIIVGILLSAVYFLPTAIARHRGHPGAGGITVMNLFLGWTVIFWFVALVASLGDTRPSTHTMQNFVDRHFGPPKH